MKLKGHVLKINNNQYTLKQQLGEGGFSLIYTTSKPDVICKVQVLSQPNIAFAYLNEKKSLKSLNHQNIVKMYATLEQKINGSEVGFMLLENCSKGTALNVLQQQPANLPEKTILKIGLDVASALQYMHSKGIVHRDVKLQNVLCNETGVFKLCDFGSSNSDNITIINKENRAQIQQLIEKTTTPLYRSPEQLDLYSGFEIGTQVDVFALGVMLFMLCFKKQPFETRLSAINKQYFLPEDHPYSQQLINIIESCFISNPRERPTASLARSLIKNLLVKKKAQIDFNFDKQFDQTIDEIVRVTEKSFRKTETVETSFFDKIKRIYNQITTETEGWIIGFIQDNEQPPNLKFNRSIISKCWQKRYKVEKFYEIMWKYSQEYKSKCLVSLKLLTLLHNFLRKGPAEGLSFDGTHSALKLCSKLYNQWKTIQKPVNTEDIKRNSYVLLLIRLYSLIIIGKIRLCFENSDIFEGNYSIVPYLYSKQDHTILRIPLIQSMLDFLEGCSKFHEILQKHSYLVDIQRTILLSIVDQQYCLVSTLTFIFAAFKKAIQFVSEDLDIERLKMKISQLDWRFKQVYSKLHELFKQTAKLASLFEHNQFQLPLKVVNYIEQIKISNQKKSESFKISQFLSYRQNICGLRIPMTYQQVVKNPTFLKDIQSKRNSKECIQLNEFRTAKQNARSVQNGHIKRSPTSQKQKPKQDQSKKKQVKTDFSSFTFQVKSNRQKEAEHGDGRVQQKDIFKTMQFTHQNLNRDFLTHENDRKKDAFADFMSLVDEKYEKEKDVKQGQRSPKQVKQIVPLNQQVILEGNINMKKKKTQQKKNQNLINFDEDGRRDSSEKQKQRQKEKEKQKIKKIQLINFFEDEEDSPKQKEVKALNLKPIEKIEPEIKLSQQQKFIQQKKQMISKIKEVNISEESFKSDSFIDLKGFIVEQVKKSAQQYIIEYSALKFKKKIGFGHSSEVFKGEWRGREVAIKKIKDDISSPNAEKQFKRQIMTSVKIRHHPQLVTLIGVAQHDNYFYIINQYCQGATLFDILHESQVPLSWRTRISIAKQIAKGMVFLHTNQPPIIHRDLKSLNVLLVNKYSDKHPDSMQIKIADFGLSRDFASTYMTGTLGTYHWMAPQIFNNQPYSLKADVYSFAIVLWQIMARKPPYLNMKNTQSLMKYVTIENGRPDLGEMPSDTPKELIEIMIKSWDKNPEVRPSFAQILDRLTAISFI